MATYAIPPQKGMADVLNEAADANERGMEGARRSALTMSQLQGEQQRQRFAEAEAGRQDKRFGFEVENQEYQRRVRQRQETYIDDVNKIGQEELFEKVQVRNPKWSGRPPVATVDAQSGTTTQAEPEFITINRPYDLNTPQGLQAVARFQLRNFQARVKAGLVDQNELNQIVTFSDMMEKRGYRDLFRNAISGDEKATAALAGKLNLDPGTTRFVADVDNDKNSKQYGIPNVFAETTVPDGKGGFTRKRTAIGHFLSMYAPEVYEATVTKPLAAIKDQSTITYQGKAGDAAVTSANAAAANAQSAAGLRSAQTNLANAQAGVLAETGGRVPNNPATDALRFSSNFSERGSSQPFKSPAMESGYNLLAGWVGQQPGLGQLSTRQFLDSEWAQIRQSIPAQMEYHLSNNPRYVKDKGKGTRKTLEDLGIDEKRELEALAVTDLAQSAAAAIKEPNTAIGQRFINYQRTLAERKRSAMNAGRAAAIEE